METEPEQVREKLAYMFCRGNFDINQKIAEDFKQYGVAAVDIVIDTISKRKSMGYLAYDCEDNRAPVFWVLSAIKDCAEERHADGLAEMLTWDEILSDTQGGERNLLLSILERIGSEKHVPFLQICAQKVKSAPFHSIIVEQDSPDEFIISADQLRQRALRTIKQTIEICKSRTASSTFTS
jgi:hypothetical protein